jgi:DNA-binding Lrp family transcriptional regulator
VCRGRAQPDPGVRAARTRLALQRDGRAGYRGLARESAVPEHRVRRKTESLVRRGMLAFRTDFARREGGRPVEVVFWLAVAYDEIELVGAHLAAWPETRIVMATVGRADLLLMTLLHRLDDLGRIRARLHDSALGPAALAADPAVRAESLRALPSNPAAIGFAHGPALSGAGVDDVFHAWLEGLPTAQGRSA